MKISALLTTLGLLLAGAAAIEMEVREEVDRDWILIPVDDEVCKTFDVEVVQINLVPWSNGGKSFLCRIYALPECQGEYMGQIPSNHPLTGLLDPPRWSVYCWTACCWP
ncbi:hypothetical protein KXW81_000254 [Aspergillus fumigatus]|nr:hypothetical protein KXW81_000254 [Aspergillus fumigatus]